MEARARSPANGELKMGKSNQRKTLVNARLYILASTLQFFFLGCSSSLDKALTLSPESIQTSVPSWKSLAPAPDETGYQSVVNAISLDSQGRPVLAGQITNASGEQAMSLWRFDSTGSIDTSFSAAAQGFSVPSTSGADNATALAIDNLNRYIVAGTSRNLQGGVESALWRILAPGIIDVSFGNGGTARTGSSGLAGASGANTRDQIHSIAIDSQNRIWLAGNSKNSQGRWEMAVWRFLENGSTDLSFGANGGVHTGQWNSDSFEIGRSIKIDSQGRAVIAGYAKNASGGYEATVWRILDSGIFDSNYGGNSGVRFGSLGAAGATGTSMRDYVFDLRIDAEGHYIMAGQSRNSSGGFQASLWRAQSNITQFDLSFSSQGALAGGSPGLAGATGANQWDAILAAALDNDNRVVAVGSSRNESGWWRAYFHKRQ